MEEEEEESHLFGLAGVSPTPSASSSSASFAILEVKFCSHPNPDRSFFLSFFSGYGYGLFPRSDGLAHFARVVSPDEPFVVKKVLGFYFKLWEGEFFTSGGSDFLCGFLESEILGTLPIKKKI